MIVPDPPEWFFKELDKHIQEHKKLLIDDMGKMIFGKVIE